MLAIHSDHTAANAGLIDRLGHHSVQIHHLLLALRLQRQPLHFRLHGLPPAKYRVLCITELVKLLRSPPITFFLKDSQYGTKYGLMIPWLIALMSIILLCGCGQSSDSPASAP